MAKTILAVDDSGSLRQMVVFSLRAAGYQVTEAVDGQDGLDKAKAQSFRSGADRSEHAAHGWISH
jgi:two-component system chemotaxis response regulator CheY